MVPIFTDIALSSGKGAKRRAEAAPHLAAKLNIFARKPKDCLFVFPPCFGELGLVHRYIVVLLLALHVFISTYV